MTQIQRLAKQGDPKAIAALINQSFNPKGLSVRADVKGSCLQILVQSSHPVNQQAVVGFITRGLDSLSPQGITTIRICGQQTDEVIPVWIEEVQLRLELPPESRLPQSVKAKIVRGSLTDRFLGGVLIGLFVGGVMVLITLPIPGAMTPVFWGTVLIIGLFGAAKRDFGMAFVGTCPHCEEYISVAEGLVFFECPHCKNKSQLEHNPILNVGWFHPISKEL